LRTVSGLVLALSFLTRLVPAKPADRKSLAGSLSWFCPAGLILGLIMILPGVLGLARGYPFVQAWMVVGIGFYLTRGLHWDGWADVWDGWASQAKKDKFWVVVKDSNVGAFGVIGLILGLGGQLVLIGEAIRAAEWAIIVWAVILGRFGAVALAWCGRGYPRPGLGSAFLDGAGPVALLNNFLVLLVFAAFFIPVYQALISLVLLSLGVFFLFTLGRRNNGINGDFLGSAVIWGELSGLLAFALVQF